MEIIKWIQKVFSWTKDGLRLRHVRRRFRDEIWEFCHKEQFRIHYSEKESPPMSEYEQGMMVAYRKVQWEAKKKCSDFGNDA